MYCTVDTVRIEVSLSLNEYNAHEKINNGSFAVIAVWVTSALDMILNAVIFG
jgi:hypothetical protein